MVLWHSGSDMVTVTAQILLVKQAGPRNRVKSSLLGVFLSKGGPKAVRRTLAHVRPWIRKVPCLHNICRTGSQHCVSQKD